MFRNDPAKKLHRELAKRWKKIEKKNLREEKYLTDQEMIDWRLTRRNVNHLLSMEEPELEHLQALEAAMDRGFKMSKRDLKRTKANRERVDA